MRYCNVEGCDNLCCVYKRKDGSRITSARCNVCNNNLKLYKITTPERALLLEAQGGKCKCCDRLISFSGKQHKSACKDNAVVDHCHTTGKIRGILCGNCNLICGRLDDDLKYVDKVKTYIKNF